MLSILLQYWLFKFVWIKKSNWLYFVLIGQQLSAYGKITHEIGPLKYPNIFLCPRFEQKNILISEYIQMLKNWLNKYPNIFGLTNAMNTNTNNICG